jgi:MoaA/NifB/PqqE/SkfB family radical SAM enzyme
MDKKVTAPLYVRIKPTNRCNHNCFFCIYNESYGNMHGTMVKRDELSREKLLEILDDFKNIKVKAVTYSGGGEPTIHPDIEEVLQKTLDYGIDLSIITNGQRLNGNIAKLLAKAKWVRISMDYADAEGFKISQRGSARMFDEIIENIQNFTKMPHECDIEVNFIITKESHSKIEKATKLLKELGVDNIRFSPVWIKDVEDYHEYIKRYVLNLIPVLKKEYETEKFKVYSSYSEHSVSKEAMHRPYTTCPFMQIVPVIGADYKVYNCHNQAYSDKGLIGSIEHQKFSKLWFSKETAEYFLKFNPQISCEGIQCAADSKNIFMNDLLNTSPDNFI